MDYSRAVPDRFRLYIFDLDGTLIDSLADLAAAVNETLSLHGFDPVDVETVRRSVGNGARNLIARCFAASAALSSCAVPEPAFLDAVMPGYRAAYEAHATDRTSLYPGIREWLEALLARGRRMVVLSNKPVAASKTILRALGTERYFSFIAGPETTGTLKPDPAGIKLALATLEISASDALMVGDSSVDIETARNAGIASCGITGGLGDEAALRAALDAYKAAGGDTLIVERT
jgi:phosphoglycolate phosphatase